LGKQTILQRGKKDLIPQKKGCQKSYIPKPISIDYVVDL